MDVSDGTAEMFPKTAEITEKFNRFLNFSYIHATTVLDLATILKNLEKATYVSEERFFIKSASLIIFEMINTYNKFQKEFRSLSEEYPEMKKPLDTLNLKIKEFKKKYKIDSKISKIRNKTIAHLDKDAKNYHKIISDFNKHNTITMTLEFMNAIVGMNEVYNKFASKNKKINLKPEQAVKLMHSMKKEIEDFRNQKNADEY